MKKIIGVFLLFFIVHLPAQQKYQSLLWKISGNNLMKDSYLYGTMHVSSKVAFRLDDIFYESLVQSDVVALESDPATWLSNSYDDMNLMGSYYDRNNAGANFYENLFKLEQPKDLAIRSFIRFDNSIINGYLYRKNNKTDNFEEETYLDMFIYQAGKKQRKEVVGLEDFKESRYLTAKASYNPVKKKLDVWLRKKYKEGTNFMLTEEAYRNRNLDLLDSIGEASNTEHFRKYMLYKRNANMVKVLDSIMQQKSVFSGVGAAHLPGDRGMIEMLRQKGYMVTPLKSKQSNYGKKVKEKIEDVFVKPQLVKRYTEDKFLAIKSFEELRELNFYGQKYYVATDMTNGGYLAITRINTFDYLSEKSKNYLKKIDDLLFEDIPGEIISKEYVKEPFEGIKIVNKTKKNDYQQYLIYKTPLEIIIVKIGGKKEYALTYGDEILASLEFKNVRNDIVELHPEYGRYTVKLPSNYIAENLKVAGKRVIQSYDDTSFYFMQEVPLYDTHYIEEDAFEAAYIHETFYKKLEITGAKGYFNNLDYMSYQSMALLDTASKRQLRLKSIVKDEIYYLLGYVGKDSIKATSYFNSFRLKEIIYKDEFKKVRDTSLHFSVVTSVKSPVISNRFYGRKKEKVYEKQVRSTKYTSKTNERIEITRTKYHDLRMFANIDSLWSEIYIKYKRNFLVTNEKKEVRNDEFIYSFVASDSLSEKRIRIKHIVKKGTLFELKTLEDAKAKSSKFVENFYNTFTPIDTLLGKTLFENKVPKFLEALRKNDSLIYQSYLTIDFGNDAVDGLIDVLSNHTFLEDHKHIKEVLIKRLIALESEKILPFLKDFYKKSYNEPQNQINIIKGLIPRNNLASYDYLLDLLAIDFPISPYSLNTIFESPKHKDSLALKRKLFPELLKYSSVQEYKRPIYSLLSILKENNLVKPRLYKKYKNQIFKDAKIELKRSLIKNARNYSSNKNFKTLFLDVYVNLLFPYREEKEAVQFFNRLIETDDVHALTSYLYLLKKNLIPVPVKLHTKVFDELKNMQVLAKKLSADELLPSELNTKEYRKKYAQSRLFDKVYYAKDTDSILFLKNEYLKTEKDDIIVYFFKLKKVNQYNNATSLHYIAFIKKNKNLVMKPYLSSLSRGDFLDDTKSESELVKDGLEKIKYKNRKRIVSGRNYKQSF
jgi:uncharacterized protein YbaP (TraB family)